VKRGSIHWAQLDKRRPALVVSHEDRNEFANDVLVLPISTSRRPMRWHVPLRKGEASMPQASFVCCESVQPVKKELIDRTELGSLSEARMREIEQALVSALGIEG
jgi:mRNA-degrading endonuclease toxin of MazEF toxin-antitoxin module